MKKKTTVPSYRQFLSKNNEEFFDLIPPLNDFHREFFDLFLQRNVEKKENIGLEKIFRSFFPIIHSKSSIEAYYCNYTIDDPIHTQAECFERGITYSGIMHINLKLKELNTNQEKDVKLYVGGIPLMTENKTFIINGHEKIIVSQIHRCPGVSFVSEFDSALNKNLYVAKIHPFNGAWIQFKVEKNCIFVSIDKKKKISLFSFLMCFPKNNNLQEEDYDLGTPLEEILNRFNKKIELKRYDNKFFEVKLDISKYKKIKLPYNLYDKNTNLVYEKGQTNVETDVNQTFYIEENDILDSFIGFDIIKDDRIVNELGSKIDNNLLQILKNYQSFEIFLINDDNSPLVLNSLNFDKVSTRETALQHWALSSKIGLHYGPFGLAKIFEKRFFDEKYYSLEDIGRSRLNEVLRRESKSSFLETEDLLLTIEKLIDLVNGRLQKDNIDSLVFRRVRYEGEIFENFFRMGIIKFEKNIRDRIYSADFSDSKIADVFNARMILYPVIDGLNKSSLCQMFDNNNHLSSIVHSRKIYITGKGGLGSSDHVSSQLRDVNDSEIRRTCPIQTPEGKNVGLIKHFAMFATPTKEGFIKTPLHPVKDGFGLSDVKLLSPYEELGKVIASKSDYKMIIKGGKKYYEPKTDKLLCRKNGADKNSTKISSTISTNKSSQDVYIGFFDKEEVDYIDISPNQIFSVSSGLTPFPGHNDAYRALTASNMNNQAVPLLAPDAPFIGTGIEKVLGDSIRSGINGVVSIVDSKQIVIESQEDDAIMEVYNLRVNKKTNTCTVITDKPLVFVGDIVKKGDIIADGFSTKNGELALGKNLLVAYKSDPKVYEDAIVISQRVVEEDLLTSISLEVFDCLVQDGRFGPEENTRDISGVPEGALSKLDENGIVRVGMGVQAGDIIVGKVTPSGGDINVKSEQKLLHAIFGDKVSENVDTSLRLPHGIDGVVTGIRILNRKGVEKDDSTMLQDHLDISSINNNTKDQIRILIKSTVKKISYLVLKKEVNETERNKLIFYLVSKKIIKSEKKDSLNALKEHILGNINTKNSYEISRSDETKIQSIWENFEKAIYRIEQNKKRAISVLEGGCTLPDGTLKLIRVFINTKRRLEVGDKLSGRYGNKGVISDIRSKEDMPYLSDGTPVDVIMNPISLIARMNLGQMFETQIGYLVYKIKSVLKKERDQVFFKKNNEELKRKLKIVLNENDLKNCGWNKSWEELDSSDYLKIAEDIIENGINFVIPQFSELHLNRVEELLNEFQGNLDYKEKLYDGRSGEPYANKVLVGYEYIYKLCHMVSLKMHARSVGPYSLTNQQPLGGKSRFGGQRVGEMEGWAKQAHGAAFSLYEALNNKSDDIEARRKTFGLMTSGKQVSLMDLQLKSRDVSESFKRFIHELRAVGFDISILDRENNVIVEGGLSKNSSQALKCESGIKIRISLATSEQIRGWANGKEITESETLNYRTAKPHENGLFCCKIFGPINDFECICGKYKGQRYEGITCEKCGVDITRSIIRRTRNSFIGLPIKVVHPWFFRTTSNKIGALINLPLKELKRIVNLELYIVCDSGSTNLKPMQTLERQEYEKHEETDAVILTGADAIYEILKKRNPKDEILKLENLIQNCSSDLMKQKYRNSLELWRDLAKSGIDPSNMIVKNLPVLPAEMRPLVELDVGQFVSSDLNDLYKTIITRTNRFKFLKNNEVDIYLVRDEDERLLQKAVSELLGTSGEVNYNDDKRHKSLEEKIKGKDGSLRRFMLGKRVDFSARSVIVVNDQCKLDECSIPKEVALELLKPVIRSRLISYGLCLSVRQANNFISERRGCVWDILEEITNSEYPYVLLNRAPTLHKVGIMGFKIKLWNKKAIGLNPLVCKAFNADFDGDQMAIHLPISNESKAEVALLMMPSKNLGSSTSGELHIGAFKDMALGIYYLTLSSGKDSGFYISSIKELFFLLENKKVNLNDDVYFLFDKDIHLVKTTAGRLVFWNSIPNGGVDFKEINKTLNNKDVQKIMIMVRTNLGDEALSQFSDSVKELGFYYSSYFTGSFSEKDFIAIPNKKEKIQESIEKHIEITEQYNDGWITEAEMNKQAIDIWSNLKIETQKSLKKIIDKNIFNPVIVIPSSGSRGSIEQIMQISHMKGSVTDAHGHISPIPIWNSHLDGLNSQQYFILAHGARKGCTDVAMKTAESGYFTRRLVDVAHGCIIYKIDCFTNEFILAKNVFRSGVLQSSVFDFVSGRVSASDIHHPITQEILIKKNTLLKEKEVGLLRENNIVEIPIRSPVLCNEKHGICALCYGSDLTNGDLVSIGEAVGVVAAQSIGEPGTQLTMRSFHSGGVASFRSLESLCKTPFAGIVSFEGERLLERDNGEVICLSRNMIILIKNEVGLSVAEFDIPYGSTVYVKAGQSVDVDHILAQWLENSPFIAEFSGNYSLVNMVRGVNYEEYFEGKNKRRLILQSNITPELKIEGKEGSVSYLLPTNTVVLVDDSGFVKFGEVLAYVRKSVESIDIVGGLVQVINILENRDPKHIASIAPISGVISMNKDKKGKILLTITDGETEVKVNVAHNVSVLVHNGQRVEKGNILTSGTPLLSSILETKGINALISYFCKEVQNIYLDQGIKIKNKHLEVILHQMCKKYEVLDEYGIVKLVDFADLDEKKKLTVKRRVLGITGCASQSSFISSASFQDTTSRLTSAALRGEIDNLLGMKERIIVGKTIPAGTGYAAEKLKEISELGGI